MRLCPTIAFVVVGLSVIVGSGEAQENLSSAEGLGYYLPKQILLLDTTTTTETSRVAVATRHESEPCDPNAPLYPLIAPIADSRPAAPPAPGRPGQTAEATPPPPQATPTGRLCIDERVVTTRAVDAQLKLVADLKAGFRRLNVPGKALADVKISVELRDGGLLKSLNAGSQGRAGDVIVGIAKLAGTVLSGGMAMLASDSSKPEPTACNPFFTPFKDQPDSLRLLLSRNGSACEAWKNLRAWNAHLQKVSGDVKAEEEKLPGMAGGAELEALIKRLKELRTGVENTGKIVTSFQTTVTAMLDTFVRVNRLGTTTERSRSVDTLDLHDLPGDAVDIVDGVTEWKPLQDQLTTANLKAAADVLKRAGVAVRLRLAGGTQPGSAVGTMKCGEAANDRLDVWFRQAQPVRLQLFLAHTPLDDEGKPRRDTLKQPLQTMKHVGERVEAVTFQGIQPRCVTFKASSFANRELVVSFDERGQLAKVDHTAGSSAAAAVTALATAATTFRDEYAATLTKMVDIDSNQRKLKLSDLTAKVDTLKKEKERLDAQLSLDATTANFDLALQQQRLAAESAHLQAQLALDTAEATNEQRLAIEQMKVEIDLVKRELELLKAKQELAAAPK